MYDQFLKFVMKVSRKKFNTAAPTYVMNTAGELMGTKGPGYHRKGQT